LCDMLTVKDWRTIIVIMDGLENILKVPKEFIFTRYRIFGLLQFQSKATVKSWNITHMKYEIGKYLSIF
jgi:hypothetical protein